jgi:hypothetical protein
MTKIGLLLSLMLGFIHNLPAINQFADRKFSFESIEQRLLENIKRSEALLKKYDAVQTNDRVPEQKSKDSSYLDSSAHKTNSKVSKPIESDIYSPNHNTSPNSLEEPINYDVSAKHSNYKLSCSYAFSFPLETAFREYHMDYEVGHHLELKFSRMWDDFFLGLSLGSKIFENENLKMPYSPGRLELPASGSNYSLFSNVSVGIEHFLNNNLFLTGSAGIGFGIAWDKIEVGGIRIFSDNDYFLYGMAQFGMGYAFNDLFSLLAYYQFDAQGSRNYYDNQYFHQVGVSAGFYF